MPGANENKNYHLICNAFSLVPPISDTVVANNGCTSHCFKPDTPCDDKQPVCDGLRVSLPNGTLIWATHTGLLPVYIPLPPISNYARHFSFFPGLTSKSLISIGQFFDDGYSAIFTAHTVCLVKDVSYAVVGHHNRSNGLWYIALTASTLPSHPPFPQAHVNSAYRMKTLKDLVIYLHRACFSPVVSTCTKSINAGYFTTWIGLTSAFVRKDLPKAIAAAKDHPR